MESDDNFGARESARISRKLQSYYNKNERTQTPILAHNSKREENCKMKPKNINNRNGRTMSAIE